METTKPKRKDGRYYLQRKLEAVQIALKNKAEESAAYAKRIEALQASYETLRKKYNRQVEQLQQLEKDVRTERELNASLEQQVEQSEHIRLQEAERHERLVEELCEHMGWFRRWLWDLKHGAR